MDIQYTQTSVSSTRSMSEKVENQRYDDKYKNEYLCYLQSQRWHTLARAVRMRAKGKCEICLRADGTECAHLTYERIFNERLTDVLWVCIKCHRELDNRW
jgi:hypothetical protein